MVVLALMCSRLVYSSSHVTQLPKYGKFTSIHINYFASFGQVTVLPEMIVSYNRATPYVVYSNSTVCLALGSCV